MADNQIIITTTLDGYINALKPSGKFNNCTIGFKLTADQLEEFDKKHGKCLEWAANKFNGKRHEKALPKWDEEGYIKYSYAGEDSPPAFPWVDAKGNLIPHNTQIRSGTVVRLIVLVSPYIYGNKGGSKFRILGAQVIKLVTQGGSDAGSLDSDQVASLFGEVDGFSVDDPNFQPEEGGDEPGEDDSDDDVPF